MIANNFIVTRYAPGAAGRFFSCCLQLSPDISSWNTKSLDLDKSSNEFRESMLDYFKESFSFDRLKHLKNEPDIPYICDFYSGTYPRGESISFNEYVNYQKKNTIDYYSIESKKNKFVNLFLHKSKIPEFLKNSIIVNILVDSAESQEIISKLSWLKHYNVIDAFTVDSLEKNPDFGNKLRRKTIKKFNKQSKIKVDSIRDFYFDKIFNNESLTKFKDKQLILEDHSNKHCKQEFINFSDILDSKKCLEEINKILEKNHLRTIASNETFILLHNNWTIKQKKILESFNIQ